MAAQNTAPWRILKAHGVHQPKVVVDEAHRAVLTLEHALAMLECETGIPQRNIFGGDYGSSYAGRPPYYHDAVTPARVTALLAQPLNNGVGWTQLTYRPFVVEAQQLGGAHIPRYQMRVGFKALAGLITARGERAGFAGYNGTGAAADAYAQRAIGFTNAWRERLGK